MLRLGEPWKKRQSCDTANKWYELALSNSASYPFSLSHNVSVVTLTYPPVQTQDRPRLLFLRQQNSGWGAFHQFYLGWSWKLGCLLVQLFCKSSNWNLYLIAQLEYSGFLLGLSTIVSLEESNLPALQSALKSTEDSLPWRHRNLKLRIEIPNSAFLGSSSTIISHETFLF